jgi:hypothetical protein
MKHLNQKSWGETTEPVKQEVEKLLSEYEAAIKSADGNALLKVKAYGKFTAGFDELIILGAISAELRERTNSQVLALLSTK